MGKATVKPKSRILYDVLRDEGMKKKKAAKISNGFVVSKRGDTSSSRATSTKRSTSGKKKSGTRTKVSTRKPASKSRAR